MFVDRLLLLIHTLYTISVDSHDAVFKQKCSSHLDDSWIQKSLVLRWVFEASLLIIKPTLPLSDNGSTLSFISTQFVKKLWAFGVDLLKP